MANENENTQPTWLGIPTQTIKVKDPNEFLFGFGNQPNLLSTQEFLTQDELYKTPAVIDALNILLKSINKNTPDEFDVNVYRAATRLIKADDICHYLNIAPASLNNLAQKSGEIEKISLPENSIEAKNKHNQQEDLAKLQKAVDEHPMIIEREREKALTLEKKAEDQKQNQEKAAEEHKKDLEDSRNANNKNKNNNKIQETIEFFGKVRQSPNQVDQSTSVDRETIISRND
jgi:hypothetical protein